MKAYLPPLLLLLSLLFSQCKKDDNCCTCEVGYSESGVGTMGCLMDGVTWAACNFAHEEVKGSLSVYREIYDGYNYWKIKNKKFFNGGDELLFVTIWYPKVGKIPYNLSELDSTHGIVSAEFFTQNGKYYGTYSTDTSKPFVLEVTKLDTVNRIISGKFECTLKTTWSIIDTTTVKITDGVFDTRY